MKKGGHKVSEVENQDVQELENEEVVEETTDTATEPEVEATEELTKEAELEKKLAEKETEAKSYLDRLQRTMAEFDNFRKRTTKEKSMMYENGAKESLEPLLAVMDNFERALDAKEEDNAFVQGIEMIYKQLKTVLEDLGVTEIEAVGQPFDPNFHNAVTHVEDDAFGENEVAEVFQKGYMYKDSVLRYSMVKVAN